MHFSSTVDCADIHSLVAMPLCAVVVWGMASQLQTAITVILTGFYLENLFWGEAKAVPN